MALGVITENGWPSCDYTDCDTSVVPGTTVSIPVQIGEPNTILKAFLADLNVDVEAYNGEGDWGGWTPTNSVATSNHLGGTAVDFNWDDHPMGPEAEQPAAGWQGSTIISGDEVPAVRQLLEFYEGLVYWGDDWTTPKDSMHFQMGYGSYDGGNTGDAWTPAMHSDPKCMDFIRRKIRKDMFSVYMRGGTSQGGQVWPTGVTSSAPLPPAGSPPPVPATTVSAPVTTIPAAATTVSNTDAINVLIAATGVSAALAAQILPQITAGLIGSQCTNDKRIAMWLAMEGEESASFTATVEIGDIDGTTYQGRTWEQITGLANYRSFSAWAFANDIPGVTSATYFVDNPAALGDPQYESLGAVWYWTIARPTINAMCDQGDVQGVCEAINGGDNGLADRTARWNKALALGDKLLTLIQPTSTPGGWLMALTDDEQQELLDKVRFIYDQVGPTLSTWGAGSSFGTYPDGTQMTERDGLNAKLNAALAILSNPKVLTVTLQALNTLVGEVPSSAAAAPVQPSVITTTPVSTGKE